MTVGELKRKFVALYGGSEEDLRAFSAAGRVNLIGEHIDYCGGLVFPAALNLRTVVVARKTANPFIRLAATTVDDRVTLDLKCLERYKTLKWGDYQAGVAYTMQNAGFTVSGCDLLYDTTVPFGSGLSSSASIEVATAIMLATFSAEAGGKGADLTELAVLGQKSENTYNGVNCGIMDQFASSLGKKDNAILLDCKTLKYEYVPLELGEYSLVVANCNKPRSLQDGKYNERRAETEEALRRLKEVLPGITCLADVSPEAFAAAGKALSGKVYDRAKHVVEECDRVKKSAQALRRGDIIAFGRYLDESHRSLRDLYEVTGPYLDALTARERETEGCIGARMTGAGFGGCTVALVKTALVDKFIAAVDEKYFADMGVRAAFYATSIENGAQELKD